MVLAFYLKMTFCYDFLVEYSHLVVATEAGGTHPTGMQSCYQYFQAWGKEMTNEQFEENLRLQKIFANLVAPGGLGQVRKFFTSFSTFKFLNKINIYIP